MRWQRPCPCEHSPCSSPPPVAPEVSTESTEGRPRRSSTASCTPAVVHPRWWSHQGMSEQYCYELTALPSAVSSGCGQHSTHIGCPVLRISMASSGSPKVGGTQPDQGYGTPDSRCHYRETQQSGCYWPQVDQCDQCNWNPARLLAVSSHSSLMLCIAAQAYLVPLCFGPVMCIFRVPEQLDHLGTVRKQVPAGWTAELGNLTQGNLSWGT